VDGQKLSAVPDQIGLVVERDRVAAEERDVATLPDRGHPRRDPVGVDPFGSLSIETQEERAVGSWPVSASEPNSSTVTRAVPSKRPSSRSDDAKRRAARIGPTVWELDGPMPMVKRSKTLIDMAGGLYNPPSPRADALG
jgi:hypothetical protein